MQWVMYFCYGILVEILLIQYMDTFYTRKCSKKTIYLIVVVPMSFLPCFNLYIGMSRTFNALICLFIECAIFKIYYICNIKDLLVKRILFDLIFIAVDFFVVCTGKMVFNISLANQFTEVDPARIMLGILSKNIFFIVIKLVSTKKWKYEDNKVFYWYPIFISYVISVSIIMMAIQALMSLKMNEKFSSFLLVGCLGLLIYNIFNFYVYINVNKAYSKEKEYALIENMNQVQYKHILQSEQGIKEIRKIKHDLNNYLIGITSLLEEGQKEEAIAYIKTISKDIKDTNNYYITGNPIVDAIVNQKYMLCKESNIQFSFNHVYLEEIKLNAQDICAILGNALDNAIEACMKLVNTDKYINLDIGYRKDCFVIKLENTYDPLQISGKLVTTKDKRWHGIGIKSIQESVQKYEGEVIIERNERTFTLKVVI